MPNFVADEIVTAAKMNLIPKGVLGYAEITADQTGITTEADITGLTVTADATATRLIRVTAGANVSAGTADGGIRLRVYEGATVIGTGVLRANTTSTVGEMLIVIARSVPAAGSRTWKATLEGVGVTVAVRAAAGAPAFIEVEDLGADV